MKILRKKKHCESKFNKRYLNLWILKIQCITGKGKGQVRLGWLLQGQGSGLLIVRVMLGQGSVRQGLGWVKLGKGWVG